MQLRVDFKELLLCHKTLMCKSFVFIIGKGWPHLELRCYGSRLALVILQDIFQLTLLLKKLGDGMCNVLPALHTLTGCDYTSKFGTKSAAVKATPVMFLKDFWSIESDIEKQVVSAEQYLVQVKKKGSTFKTCDELRDFLYHHSKTSDLPPTSHELKMHILRALYATNQMKHGLMIQEENVDPTSFGFELLEDILIPQKGRNPIPDAFTVTCQCLKCASAQRCHAVLSVNVALTQKFWLQESICMNWLTWYTVIC